MEYADDYVRVLLYILTNRSTQESMPITAMPDGKIVCIGGDGGESNSTRNTDCRELDGSLLKS